MALGIYGRPMRPVDKQYVITLPFGAIRYGLWATHDDHWGTDFGCPVGTPCYAAEDGIIFSAEDPAGWGHYLMLQSGNDYYIYGHLSEWKVAAGDQVKKGQLIGLTGCTGNCHGPHLHFERRYKGTAKENVAACVFFDEAGNAYYS